MEKPILFNTEMVKAILEGRKTQTRRLIKRLYIHEPYATEEDGTLWISDENGEYHRAEEYAPYKPGDLLYVRETWKQATTGTAGPGLIDLYLYKADEPQDTTGMMVEGRWHPSIHMPKEAARIWLKVKRVRAERLKDITEEDAEAEGCQAHGVAENALERFMMVWNSTMSLEDRRKYGFWKNPWVWVIEFERTEGKHDD